MRRFIPVAVALGLAVVTSSVRLSVDIGLFESGPLSFRGLYHLLELKAYDSKLVDRELPGPPAPKVVVAAVDEKAMTRFGRWPWSRAVLANFVRSAADAGARVIAFDSGFVDEQRNANNERIGVEDDVALGRALAEGPTTVLGFFGIQPGNAPSPPADEIQSRFDIIDRSAIRSLIEHRFEDVGSEPIQMAVPVPVQEDLQIREIVDVLSPLTEIASHADSFGHVHTVIDTDGTGRRARLFLRHGTALYPALSLATVAAYRSEPAQPINSDLYPGIRVGGVVIGDDSSIPTNGHGVMYINYYDDPTSYFPTVSVADFIDGEAPADKIRGNIVLLGVTAVGLGDQHLTPFGHRPGVYMHAALMQSILDGRFIERFYGLAVLEAILYLLLGLALGVGMILVPRWAIPVIGVGFLVLLWVIDNGVFASGVWLKSVLPAGQIVVTTIALLLLQRPRIPHGE